MFPSFWKWFWIYRYLSSAVAQLLGYPCARCLPGTPGISSSFLYSSLSFSMYLSDHITSCFILSFPNPLLDINNCDSCRNLLHFTLKYLSSTFISLSLLFDFYLLSFIFLSSACRGLHCILPMYMCLPHMEACL